MRNGYYSGRNMIETMVAGMLVSLAIIAAFEAFEWNKAWMLPAIAVCSIPTGFLIGYWQFKRDTRCG